MKKLFILTVLMSSILFAFNTDLSLQNKFLKPSDAFIVEADVLEDKLQTKITLGKDIHLYQDSLKYTIIKPQKLELKPTLPPAIDDDGDKIYEHEVIVDFDLKEFEKQLSGDYTLQIDLMGCSASGICYQPISKTFDFKHRSPSQEAPKAKAVESPKEETKESSTFEKISALTQDTNTKNIANVLAKESFWFILFLFFVFGLLLSLTPCIFPMIPILSSIIVSQSGEGKPSASKGFFISLVYVLSMAVTYTVVGLIAGLMGADIQASMQNPWVLSVFAALFVALAFSLFGYYELGLPSSWQSKLTKMSDNAQGQGGVIGTALMGLLSALIVGPCVAPPLGGAILFISHSGDALLGGLALFVMSFGMGVPLLLIGLGAGKFMPRPGGWMSRVSQFFGIIMLLLAIFMISRILNDTLTLLLYSLWFIGVSIYFGIFNNEKVSSFLGYISKILAVVAMLYAVSLFIGVLSGATSMLKPFEKFTTSASITIEKSDKKNYKGYSIERLEKEIAASDKPVIVDFTKKACTACTELDTITFSDAKVKDIMQKFTFIKVDLSDNTQDDKDLLNKYELFGTPNIIFFDKQNRYLSSKTITGFIAPEPFIRHL
ncbi:MAG: protein-disulfide reductase DsbD, partial [Campylobacterales bacterium]|nr:protein-disulfide reductase DsbD [Campylobacterales bacterium]